MDCGYSHRPNPCRCRVFLDLGLLLTRCPEHLVLRVNISISYYVVPALLRRVITTTHVSLPPCRLQPSRFFTDRHNEGFSRK